MADDDQESLSQHSSVKWWILSAVVIVIILIVVGYFLFMSDDAIEVPIAEPPVQEDPPVQEPPPTKPPKTDKPPKNTGTTGLPDSQYTTLTMPPFIDSYAEQVGWFTCQAGMTEHKYRPFKDPPTKKLIDPPYNCAKYIYSPYLKYMSQARLSKNTDSLAKAKELERSWKVDKKTLCKYAAALSETPDYTLDIKNRTLSALGC
jgi:hypothetical protein